jgi:hypothetical protein
MLSIEPPADVDPDRAVNARWNADQEAALAMARERAAVLHPPSQTRPWYWPHEQRIGNAYLGEDHDWPLCYPHDWPEPRTDLYGFGDEWTGEVLVIPADELPHEAEVVPRKRPARYGGEARAELNDGIEDAEIIEEPAETSTEAGPERSRSALLVRGGWRTLGTLENGEFRPNTTDPFSR